MRTLAIAAVTALLSLPAAASYHYVYYGNGSFTPIRAQFDLSKLPSKTITFFVSDGGPETLFANDTFGSVLGEVKQALAAWNAVSTSDLRVAFGGLESQGQTSNTPVGDVIFTDLPPGILGMGTPNLPAVPSSVNGPNGPFVPIARATVLLTNNTGLAPGPSYLEGFFTTAVHEVGHALGLQHTWTGSAMSQDVIRNTSRARALDADDIAAVSILYGKANWTANYGSISGHVTFNNGQPVSLASVVAIAPNGPAVSALTNPDGSYRIDGLPPNTYLLYVHPLPPDAVVSDGSGLLLPESLSGQPFAPSGAFQTVFFPGTLNPQTAPPFVITAGTALTNENFSVQPQSAVSMYDVVTYSYLDPGSRNYTNAPPANYVSTTPAFVNATESQVLLVAQENPPLITPTPQSVTILGGLFGNATPQVYNTPPALALRFNMPLFAGTGPRHLIFNFGNDIYVLPNGVNLVQNGPPFINSVNPNGDGTVTVSGSNFGPDSRVFFDGIEAAATLNGGAFTVTPPPGANGQISTVTVFNSDGQNSMFLQQKNPPTYAYAPAGTPQINVTPASLPAGVSAMVDITGVNMNFVSGQVTVGFGTGDVVVNRVWVLSPTHLVANISSAPGAAIGSSEISVISGFQVASQPFAFQTQPANLSLPSIALPVVNAQANQVAVYAGGFAAVYGSNLAQSAGSVQVTLNGAPMFVQFASQNQVNFAIPAGFALGPAIMKLSNGAGSASVVVEIDSPPLTVLAITNAANLSPDATHPAGAGDTITLLVSGLDPAVLSNPGRVQVTVAGLNMPIGQIVSLGNGQFQIPVVLNRFFGGLSVPVILLVDGSPTPAGSITAR